MQRALEADPSKIQAKRASTFEFGHRPHMKFIKKKHNVPNIPMKKKKQKQELKMYRN